MLEGSKILKIALELVFDQFWACQPATAIEHNVRRRTIETNTDWYGHTHMYTL